MAGLDQLPTMEQFPNSGHLNQLALGSHAQFFCHNWQHEKYRHYRPVLLVYLRRNPGSKLRLRPSALDAGKNHLQKR
jgi:hypothetical protein